jgi:hypothetical protein
LICAFKKGCHPAISVAIINSTARTFEDIKKQATRMAERFNMAKEETVIESALTRDDNCFKYKIPEKPLCKEVPTKKPSLQKT